MSVVAALSLSSQRQITGSQKRINSGDAPLQHQHGVHAKHQHGVHAWCSCMVVIVLSRRLCRAVSIVWASELHAHSFSQSRSSVAAPCPEQSPPITPIIVVYPYKILTKLVFYLPKTPKFPACEPIRFLDPDKKVLRYRRYALRYHCFQKDSSGVLIRRPASPSTAHTKCVARRHDDLLSNHLKQTWLQRAIALSSFC